MGAEEDEEEDDPLERPSVGVDGREQEPSDDVTESFKGFFPLDNEDVVSSCCCVETEEGGSCDIEL